MIRRMNWHGSATALWKRERWMRRFRRTGLTGAREPSSSQAVAKASETPSQFRPLYELSWPLKKKVETIATTMYGADGVVFEAEAERQLETAQALGFGELPVCMAKTALSLSHDPALKGRPSGFTVPIKELRILAGAGFVTAVCSGMQLMPGLPKKPAGERIDLNPETGEIIGLA
jgi:formyltetrahydrofolate synthetase